MGFNFNNEEQAINRLQELMDCDIPQMSLEKLLNLDNYSYLKPYVEQATEGELHTCDEHLSHYCEPGYNENKDIFSDETCLFYWGLAHGEMLTNDNGLARTYYHYLTLAGKRHRVDMLLQFHPSCYSTA